MIWIFAIHSLSVSATDCFSTNSRLWKLNGNYSTVNDHISFNSENDDNWIDYISNRYRKKWMVSFCGEIEDSYLLFKSLEGDDTEKLNDTKIEIKKDGKKLNFKLYQNSEVIAEEKVSKSSTLHSFCFNVISGRGYFGMFGMNNNHKKEGEQIFVKEISIPRKHTTTYYSRKPSNLTRFCVGDFFGDQRISARPDDDKWDSHINDFL
ncbi:hypothetical protein TRFO_07103 [Tritrichomonas foetus]|uniref:Uncharacterized protein n=1 Tax=Tritrichomonas foetus TaxID=1144522 RepID=A0A1J4JXQ1_9EUKA|nr:hypothetical protein TRFO_07103 [Tritrichomonas foetus]|eukprot:OHT02302.1 hypothetical protein TRFO_07103 [Tritrichomonas foetus]